VEKSVDANSVKVMKEDVEALEKKVRSRCLHSSFHPLASGEQDLIQVYVPVVQLRSDSTTFHTAGSSPSPAPSPARPRPSTNPSSPLSSKLRAIHLAHSELSSLWAAKKGRIITAWADLSIKELRVQKCKEACNGLVPVGLEGQRDYPEVRFLDVFFLSAVGSAKRLIRHYVVGTHSSVPTSSPPPPTSST
jgi:hypothetical protein